MPQNSLIAEENSTSYKEGTGRTHNARMAFGFLPGMGRHVFVCLSLALGFVGEGWKTWDVFALVLWTGAARMGDVNESRAVSEQPTATAAKDGQAMAGRSFASAQQILVTDLGCSETGDKWRGS